MTNFPRTIHFLHDDCVAELVGEITGAKVKERMANYQYTKARVNNGQVFTLFLSQLIKLLDSKSITVE